MSDRIDSLYFCKDGRYDLDNVKITDNFLFTEVFSNKNLLKRFLEIFLNIKDVDISSISREYVIYDLDNSKDVRLDLFAEDKDTVYNIEIQTSNTYDLPRRTRYYQSKIDRKYLHKGDKTYNKLLKSFIIFICTFNPFRESINQPIYVFENMCVASNNSIIKLNDQTYKVFINSQCDIKQVQDNNIKAFVELINDGFISKTKTTFIDDVINEANRLRENGKWRSDYMTIMQEYAKEYADKVLNQERIDIATKMLKMDVNDDIILNCSNLTQSQLEEIKNSLKNM